MKTNRYFIFTLVVIGCVAIKFNAMAACQDNQAHCIIEQILRDDAARAAYNTEQAGAWSALQSELSRLVQVREQEIQAARNARNARIGDPEDPWSDDGECYQEKIDQENGVEEAYWQAEAQCSQEHPEVEDPQGYAACMCEPTANYNYNMSVIEAQSTACIGDATADYNYSVAIAHVNYNVGVYAACAVYTSRWGEANAVLAKTLKLNAKFSLLCQYAESVIYLNCLLTEDCAEYPPHCCEIGCEKTYFTATFYILANFVESTLSAEAMRDYKVVKCGVTQSVADFNSEAVFYDEYHGANGGAGNARDVAKENVQYNFEYSVIEFMDDLANALCGCSNSTQAEHDACFLPWRNYYNGWLDYYNNLHTSELNRLNQQLTQAQQNALSKRSAAYLAHASAADACMTSAINDYNVIYNNAIAIYNAAMNAAYEAYEDCVEGCYPAG